ncbi:MULTISPECIES: multidrug effflux MFS transporter [unclassified Polaromonas]|jgi:DHA1 family bicyclomycin/chloramphenicol resistance-like MFS transporter|uniref:multidrug effflux MFS transporter n=1 Tax=unclassified Polaromonas TaxID=2638319 RepID=UPI000BC7504A|nr:MULTISPECIES: multidrug effflux MFS transporter [unclassified Polaromonas]OYY33806.1 MAG: Bcr/CflA family drug resistance efflux transporter [Polaromonas sp. 35-63-35]OYZ19467.1 MAG: Bcr/CflA family drug resistance efflux transporter [Polaromonas sp. 16-63-31]OYZ77379.1 MAG: Bcr/CflA family drug resistance efflux transporter [Polaromonas sp. 24-63-21]OZA48319.1 MAG: Bcr/CflA family drug resistance efflux transporter [Polaromonas sp. 17-63-33]OZA86586.1 MAG: Bcr/CflA family drug resistance e
MNPDADQLWRAPRWALAVLLALLGMLGPFSIDTYIPAFSGIARSLGATPVEMQQTLSAYLFGFAFMNLFHGALADSFGRRPVVLWGIAMFTLASAGCALSQSIEQLVFFRALQGLSTGAGIVVSRAVIRDMFAPAQAQKVMSQVTIYFGVAPAIAPIIGGWLFVHLNWHAIFWFLTGVGVLLWTANYKLLPETLHVTQRQPFNVKHLMRGYWQLGSSARFFLLALASGVPFNGMFLYVLAAPEFLGVHMGLAPTEFFWFFVLTIAGIMAGAWVSGRMAGKIAPKQQIRHGFVIMLVIAVLNLAANLLFKAHVSWALFPIAIFAFGWALMVPVVTLLVLDLYPERRGMASSLQAFIGSTANGIVAGVIAPLIMHSTVALAATSLLMMSIGLLAWLYLHHRWPEIGKF